MLEQLKEVRLDGRKECNQEEAHGFGYRRKYAHTLADDKKWDDVKILAAGEIAQICETDSETAATIKSTIDAASQERRRFKQ